jgi:hypothetical protein
MGRSRLGDLELEAWGGFLRTHFLLHRELERGNALEGRAGY